MLIEVPEEKEDETKDPRNWYVATTFLVIFLVGALVVIVGGYASPGYHIVPALIWAFGFCASGMLLGFLFAIPRTLPAGTLVVETRPEKNEVAASSEPSSKEEKSASTENRFASQHSEINSNLVEVSDWLTKIIVGVGLVELRELPTAAQSVTDFIAPSLGLASLSTARPIAGSIMLFFSVHGFLIGYLLTRIYVAVIIKHADNRVKEQNGPVRLGSGKLIRRSEWTRLVQDLIADMQLTLARLVNADPQNEKIMAKADAFAAAGPAQAPARRILWVDDQPQNNLLLVEQLTKAGVEVETAITTNQALMFVRNRRYDAIVTDMGRMEEKGFVENAGMVLLLKLREIAPTIPAYVFTSRSGSSRYGDEAVNAGAHLVTTSATQLLSALDRLLVTPKGPDS